MDTKAMIQIMQAYEDGKQIEVFDEVNDRWRETDCPVWDWYEDKYRIKATKKPVDLSVLIDSGIDCEFGEANFYIKAGLENIITYGDSKVAYQARDLGNRYSKCRPRMNHIHAWQGGECPLPEGFMVKVWFRDGQDDVMEATKWGVHWRGDKDGDDIIAFEVIGLADGYCYPWECDE